MSETPAPATSEQASAPTSPLITSPTQEQPSPQATSSSPETTTTEPPASAFSLEEVTLDALKGYLPKDTTLNESLAGEFVTMLNGAKSRGDIARGVIKLQEQIQTQAITAISEAWDAQQTAWKNEMTADPTFGGAALEANLAKVKQTILTYADNPQQVLEFMTLTGAGNNLHVAKLLLNLANAVPQEAKPVNGAAAPVEKGRAEKLFTTQL